VEKRTKMSFMSLLERHDNFKYTFFECLFSNKHSKNVYLKLDKHLNDLEDVTYLHYFFSCFLHLTRKLLKIK